MPTQTTTEKAVKIAEGPVSMEEAHPERVYTMDNVIKELAGGEWNPALNRMLVWEARGARDIYALPVFQAAMRGEEFNFPPMGDVQDVIDRFWSIHSRYIGPSCEQVYFIYQDIVGHVVSLAQRYQRNFITAGSKVFKELVEALAVECNKPDDAEKSREDNVGMLQLVFDSEGFHVMLGRWFEEWAWIPKPDDTQTRDQVNMNLNADWYFRTGGVIDRCVGLIRDVCEWVRNQGHQPIEDLCQYDLANLSRYQILKSCTLLGNRCVYTEQENVTLAGDWWSDRRTNHLIEFPLGNTAIHDQLTGIFVYSHVDAGQGIYWLLDEQRKAMHGRAKRGDTYDLVKRGHLDARHEFPPWRTQRGAWPADSFIERTNYDAVESLLKEVQFGGVGEIRVKRVREPAEAAKAGEPPKAKLKKIKTEKIPAGTVQEVVMTDEDNNFALWGGLAAITAGVGALVFSRRRVR